MRSALLLITLALPAASEVHTIFPNHHSRNLSAQKEPILRVRSGDRVVTRTWDSGGGDEYGVHHLQHPYVPPEGGNPLFGPFYVEGAEPGDALEVRLDKVRVNRNYGYTTTGIPDSRLKPGDTANSRPAAYEMHAVRPKRDDLIPWDIDLQRLTTSPRLRPAMRSDWKIEIPVRPHIGTMGVAEPGAAREPYSPISTHGGNMDYNDIAEGATLYFPVYHRGAYFYLGDGHALQGDGEGFGAGVETSLNVEFTVRVVKGKNLTGPRLVNATHIASIVNNPAKDSNTDSRLREGNSDMLRWLREECGLTLWESHMLIGSVVEHKIGTYWTTTVTLIPKRYVPARCHQLEDASQ
ncbi:MAG: acetamidase/formamidase family protein [Bryobacterales bacterium]|nr:acetamidase/formamidase family protein [Bryobacterales bacterium]